MKGKDAFERSVKEALDSYEVPYNSADWAQLDEQLNKGRNGSWQGSVGLYALLLCGSLAVATTIHMLSIEQIEQGRGMAVIQGHQDDTTEVMILPVQEATAGSRENELTEPLEKERIEDPSYRTEPDPTPTRDAVQTHVTPIPERSTNEPAQRGGNNSSELTIRPSITEGCPGTVVEFSVNNLPEGGIHLWNFGDGSFSNQPNPKHVFSKAGTYEVMLSHSSLGGGSIHNKPVSDRIIIHDSPGASFNFLKREYDNTIPSVHFENRSVGGVNYHWDFGDGATSTVAHPDHVYKKKGLYTVTLTASNAMGCTDRTDRSIRIDSDYDLFAPKTFSPNGDGVEDTFIPEALRELGVRFQMSIFDRDSGQLLFETRDPLRPWNGRIGNKGEICAPGDYVWMVEMKDGDKLGGTYNGTVGLLR